MTIIALFISFILPFVKSVDLTPYSLFTNFFPLTNCTEYVILLKYMYKLKGGCHGRVIIKNKTY